VSDISRPGLEGEIGYRVTRHINKHFAWSAPVVPLHYRKEPEGDDRSYTHFGVGVGALVKTNSPALPSLEVTPLQWFWRTSGSQPRLRAEVAAYTLAGKARVGVVYMHRRQDEFLDGGRWGISAGIADLSGLMYWFIH
jgi:hypothetical protein